jgi:DMSO/TMAO reductase YedYZ molybdopterin-dependent catalytic subunit
MSRLRIEGEVTTPREIGFDDLASLPEQVADVSALVPGREGGAVRLRSVLAAVGVKDGATHVTLDSEDGSFSQDAPLAALGNAVLLYRIDDRPLPKEKGGPVRFLIPDLEDCGTGGVDRCTNVKGLGRILVKREAR